MSKLKSFLKLLNEPGPLVVLAVVIAMLVGIAGPASAQFFNFNPFASPRPAPRGGGGGGGWFGNDFFAPYPQQQPKKVTQDYSKAPPPEKRDSAPERYVLVLGDGMADWLAYGLEDAYSEQPDMGVTRKIKTNSGLIKYQPKGDPADWAAAAKGILATERADAIVIMLGLNDRISLREPVVEKTDKPDDKKAADKAKKDAKGKPGETKPGEAKPDGKTDTAAKPDDKPADSDLPQDEADNDTPAVAAPEKAARAPGGLYEFRDERWAELYTKKIEEMIAVAKSKGVPVLWVGLPAVRGPKGTADTLYLDSLYRDAAGKAGITYVDVWDGFVDEAGRFLQKGPDFEGQIRQLRSYDGVYFTRPGARKLAHYAEREINRLLATRSAPLELPSEPATPDANAVPGQPAPRPVAGPILPLVASSVGTDQLLGGPGSRPANVDALAARTLVKGEALSPPAGRADDFVWPRREVGREQAKEPPKELTKPDTPVAATSPTEAAPAAPGQLPAQQRQKRMTTPAPPAQQQPSQAQQPNPGIRDFFGFGAPQPQQQPARPPAARNPNAPPRPPGSVGRAAAVLEAAPR
ncbi:SGNH/GDSL hydrolase family protein [Bradyrhizobium sp. HKCCYLR20261]|uniref:SGNH/GDSL hydrolase family protein n=1 Tax=Bradyrhizobium sp. HKCCYLR20261 TaxID=3420760 RepID=UPI003EB9F708